jgi:CHAT domain-containing protein
MGLSWSLFAAGASTALVSQWEVDSASTTALMIAFHERLLLSGKDGSARSDTPEALRVAAMRLMRSAAYRHSFYWAGFVIVGAS